jgi:hypothetical protein
MQSLPLLRNEKMEKIVSPCGEYFLVSIVVLCHIKTYTMQVFFSVVATSFT